VDAVAAAAFHEHREAHPELFTSRTRNQVHVTTSSVSLCRQDVHNYVEQMCCCHSNKLQQQLLLLLLLLVCVVPHCAHSEVFYHSATAHYMQVNARFCCKLTLRMLHVHIHALCTITHTH
jgi:Diacylglycerol kinase accessory domain